MFIALSICVVTAVISVYSLSLSTYTMSFEKAYSLLLDYLCDRPYSSPLDYIERHIVVDLTLPRTVCAVLIGAVLAICGGIMQSLTHNPLTDPYTMGVSSAALLGVAIGAAFGIFLVPGLSYNGSLMANAFIFAMIPSVFIILISSFKNLSSSMMVLVGIGLMYVFSAFSTFIKVNAEDETLSEIYEWSVGTLDKINPDSVLPVFAVFLVSISVCILMSQKINIISSGDQLARSLGENPVRIRLFCFTTISVCVAICVAFSGTIGFVGLVAPHVARLFTGNNNKIMLPASAIIGAFMLLVSDCVVRSLPVGLPVGVVTALVGSPLFIYFLYRQRKASTF